MDPLLFEPADHRVKTAFLPRRMGMQMRNMAPAVLPMMGGMALQTMAPESPLANMAGMGLNMYGMSQMGNTGGKDKLRARRRATFQRTKGVDSPAGQARMQDAVSRGKGLSTPAPQKQRSLFDTGAAPAATAPAKQPGIMSRIKNWWGS